MVALHSLGVDAAEDTAGVQPSIVALYSLDIGQCLAFYRWGRLVPFIEPADNPSAGYNAADGSGGANTIGNGSRHGGRGGQPDTGRSAETDCQTNAGATAHRDGSTGTIGGAHRRH